MRLLTIICMLLLAAPIAHAQRVVGRAVVDGRAVELLSDKSWRFEEQVAAGCNSLTIRLTFCGASDQWVAVSPANADIVAQFRYDDRNYAQYIIEDLGTRDGLNLDGVRNAVLSNAAAASNRKVNDVPVYDRQEIDFKGTPAETLTYRVVVDGTDYVFMNTIILKEDMLLQAISYAVGADWTQEAKNVHAAFLEATELP